MYADNYKLIHRAYSHRIQYLYFRQQWWKPLGSPWLAFTRTIIQECSLLHWSMKLPLLGREPHGLHPTLKREWLTAGRESEREREESLVLVHLKSYQGVSDSYQ